VGKSRDNAGLREPWRPRLATLCPWDRVRPQSHRICKPNLFVETPRPGDFAPLVEFLYLAGNKGCARMDGDLFFGKAGLNRKNVQAIIDRALVGSDDGELFLEFCRSESFS